MKKKIYIAGKVSGLPVHDVTMKFGAVQKEIEAQGFEAVNPIAVVNNWNCDWNTAMKKCIQALLECDAVLFLPCWMDSRGAILEHKIATDLEIKTLIGTKDLKKRI